MYLCVAYLHKYSFGRDSAVAHGTWHGMALSLYLPPLQKSNKLLRETMVPAASITLATHAFGNAILLYYMFSPLLEHDSIVMVSMIY